MKGFCFSKSLRLFDGSWRNVQASDLEPGSRQRQTVMPTTAAGHEHSTCGPMSCFQEIHETGRWFAVIPKDFALLVTLFPKCPVDGMFLPADVWIRVSFHIWNYNTIQPIAFFGFAFRSIVV